VVRLPCILFRDVLEIQQLYDPARGREDVRWFEVAMNDPLGVCGPRARQQFAAASAAPHPAEGPALFTVDDRPARRCTHDQKIRADVVNLADIE